MFEPKTLAPLPDTQVSTRLERTTVSAKMSTLVCAPGVLSEAGLAADLAACGNRLSWLRPAVFDLQPATTSRRNMRVGGSTMVVDASNGASSSALFLPYLFDLASRPGTGDVIVLSDREILPALPGTNVTQPDTCELLHLSSLGRIAAPARQHLQDLVTGRPALASSLARPLWHLGTERFEWSVLAATTMSELMGNIVSLYLSRASAAHIVALEAACILGYAHESLAALRPLSSKAPTEPWWEPLAQGWMRLSPSWRSTLAQQCLGRAPGAVRVQGNLVDQLVSRGAVCEAIEMRMTTGAFDDAAKLIHREADSLLAIGRHDVLATWLERLPLDEVPKGRRLRKLRATCMARADLTRLAAAPTASWCTASQVLGPAAKLPCAPVPNTSTVTNASTVTGTPIGARKDLERVAVSIDLLGSLRVVVGGVAVKRWTGATGRNLLRYIAMHHPRPVAVERLQETFWPDVAARISKNRLHVALHTLRADLRRYGHEDMVEFRDGAYQLSEGLDITLDLARFAKLLDQSLAERDPPTLVSILEEARSLYRGDFLEDSPYESWATLEREMWKVRHLGLLERLAHTYFVLGWVCPGFG